MDHHIWYTLAHTESLRESADYGTGELITEEMSSDVLFESREFIRIMRLWL